MKDDVKSKASVYAQNNYGFHATTESLYSAYLNGYEARNEEVLKLQNILRQIRNSVAIASWNVDDKFKQFTKEMNKIITDAVDK